MLNKKTSDPNSRKNFDIIPVLEVPETKKVVQLVSRLTGVAPEQLYDNLRYSHPQEYRVHFPFEIPEDGEEMKEIYKAIMHSIPEFLCEMIADWGKGMEDFGYEYEGGNSGAETGDEFISRIASELNIPRSTVTKYFTQKFFTGEDAEYLIDNNPAYTSMRQRLIEEAISLGIQPLEDRSLLELFVLVEAIANFSEYQDTYSHVIQRNAAIYSGLADLHTNEVLIRKFKLDYTYCLLSFVTTTLAYVVAIQADTLVEEFPEVFDGNESLSAETQAYNLPPTLLRDIFINAEFLPIALAIIFLLSYYLPVRGKRRHTREHEIVHILGKTAENSERNGSYGFLETSYIPDEKES